MVSQGKSNERLASIIAPNTTFHSEIFERLGKKIVDLYAQVIRGQMRMACQYSRSSFLRFWRDVVQVDDWQQSLTSLENGKASIDEDLRAIGDHTLRQVDVKVSELHEKADKTIHMLNVCPAITPNHNLTLD